MPFAWYERLTPSQKAVYRRSDAITALELAGAEQLRPTVAEIERGLARDDRRAVAAASRRLVAGLSVSFKLAVPTLEVLEVRPHNDAAELHGLYTLTEEGAAHIRLWMRTARKARVVAFRTFLRTLLHEYCHHLDFTGLGLPDSFHTEGFFKRESSLFRQLVPRQQQAPEPEQADRQLSLLDPRRR